MSWISYLKILAQILIVLEKVFLKSLLRMKKRLIIIICVLAYMISLLLKVLILEEIATLYDLLIYLLDNSTRIISSRKAQTEFLEAITALKIIISSIKTDVTDQSREQKKKSFAEQESVLNNAELLLKKRNDITNQFTKNKIISKNEKFYDAPKKSKESISEKSEQKFDQSISKWVQVPKDRFDFIKLKININKSLATMIDNKRYKLNDANELVNKIAEQKSGKNNAIKEYNNLVNKAEKIAELRSTEPRQKMLKIFNYLVEIFNGQTTEGKGLKILTSNQMLRRLSITIAQLKAGNNSEKLKNEIRQL